MPVAPYDPYAPPAQPWWQQPQAPRQGVQFGAPPPPQQPKQWYEGLAIPKDPYGKDRSANSANSSANSANSTNQPPNLFEMMTNLGRMTPAEYNKRVQGTGPSAQVSPWAWLGSMWGGGGPPR